MIVKRSLNNNVLLVDDDNHDVVLIGGGIGYNKKKGDIFDEYEKIEQKFVLEDERCIKKYEEVLKENDDKEILMLVEETIQKIKNENIKMNDNIHITLLDHMSFAIDRYKKGLIFNNIFNDDIKFLYEKEYAYATELIAKINKKKNISLNESEIGVVALHVNSAINNEDLNDVRLKQTLINEIVSAICQKLEISPNIKSLSYQRMLIHIRFAIYRVLDDKQLDDSLNEFIKNKYSEFFEEIKQTVIPVAEKI